MFFASLFGPKVSRKNYAIDTLKRRYRWTIVNVSICQYYILQKVKRQGCWMLNTIKSEVYGNYIITLQSVAEHELHSQSNLEHLDLNQIVFLYGVLYRLRYVKWHLQEANPEL